MAEDKKGTGWEYAFKRTPYGVKITRPKGKIPEKLKGYFTDETFARMAVNTFTGNMKNA